VVCLFPLWGCAYTPPAPLELDESNINSVAIVSLVPEKANLQRIGLTAFNNDRIDVDLGGRISRTIDSVASAHLSAARPQWTIKRITYDRDALVARMKGPGLGRADDGERLFLDLADLCRVNGVDALFVVGPWRSEDPHYDGVGVYLRTLSSSPPRHVTVHSDVALFVVGSNGQVIARSRAGREPRKLMDAKALGIEYELKDNLRPDIIGRLSDAMIEQLTKSLNSMFDGFVMCKKGTCAQL
jgi:hypothetical protein